MAAYSFFTPVSRAVGQLGDPAFTGVLWRSAAWSALCFALLHVAALWLVNHVLAMHGPLAYAMDVLGALAASLLTAWLFLPLAAAIGTIYIERIARAVEARYYPFLPAARGAPVAEQAWDGLVVALRVLAFNVVALILAIILPGIGLIIGWMIAAYAMGRGLFVAVAMRRMSRAEAEAIYQRRRGAILAQGGVLALAGYVPLLNLLLAVVGTAAMVHVLDDAMTQCAKLHGTGSSDGVRRRES